MFWIELKCDLRKPGCYSDRDKNPMGMSQGDRISVSHTLRSLEESAINEGWVRKSCGDHIGMICPMCKRKNEEAV